MVILVCVYLFLLSSGSWISILALSTYFIFLGLLDFNLFSLLCILWRSLKQSDLNCVKTRFLVNTCLNSFLYHLWYLRLWWIEPLSPEYVKNWGYSLVQPFFLSFNFLPVLFFWIPPNPFILVITIQMIFLDILRQLVWVISASCNLW